MADEEKRITMTFGGYDDNDDQTIMFEGPLQVAKTLNNIEDLRSFDVSPYEGSEYPLVVYVKNVNDPSIDSGKIPYRGSFYKWDWDLNNWIQLVLGNHSHSNMEILDQLGEINTASMQVGDKKMLVIEKITQEENTTTPRSYEYKISYEDLNVLPEVPEDAAGKNLYLTADKSGKFQWANSFVPAQTFKSIKITVDHTFIGEDNSSKTLILSKSYMETNDIIYNKDLGDEVLVFDSGNLVSDLLIEYENDELKLTVTNDKESDTFEIGEKIAILIIRSGIAGLLDTIKTQYMTKGEAIELLTNGTINLNSYITKDDLRKYAAQLNHSHSEYLRRNDYDAFDFRYADYQHIHSEYITKADVLAILTDNSDDDGNIDFDGVVRELVSNLETQLAEALANVYTREQTQNLITSQIEAKSNSDAITVSLNGQTLTDYLRMLYNKQSEIEELDAGVVQLEADRINLGEGESIGGYENGEEIHKGTTLTQFIHRLVTNEKVPVLVEPKVTISHTVNTYESGERAFVNITAHVEQNDGGTLKSLTLNVYRDSEEPIHIEDIEPEEKTTLELNLNAFNSSGLCYRIEVVGEFNDGMNVVSNVGKTYKINAGAYKDEIEIYSRRYMYFGSLRRDVNSAYPLTQDDIWTALYNTELKLLNSYYDESIINDELDLVYRPEEEVRTLLFCVPKSSKYSLRKIIYKNQNFDMMEDFINKRMLLKDIEGKYPEFINNEYDVYYYSFAQKIRANVEVKLQFDKEE